uniref:Uncharacterized protein n=1 Tax=Anguilla anguilla TaxID=7936 RepID=A0A0E9ULT4_ANGAN
MCYCVTISNIMKMTTTFKI